MNLNELVKEVLSPIISGISDAQYIESGSFVIPAGDGSHDYAKHPRVSSIGGIKSTIVDFEIAPTVKDLSKGSSGGGLKVFGIGAQ